MEDNLVGFQINGEVLIKMFKMRCFGLIFALLAMMLVPMAFADNSQGTASVTIENFIDSSTEYTVNSFVITSPQGVKVFFDLTKLPKESQEDFNYIGNLLTVTHTHPDHYNMSLVNGFKGKKIVATTGMIESGDVKIEGVNSSHSYDSADGSNIIFIVDIAGLRIADFGDCGQTKLTPEQMEKIGHIDVAIAQFENQYSAADASNKKCFKFIAQVNPTIIIPTHISSTKAVKLLNESWPVEVASRTKIVIDAAVLAKGKRAIFIGRNTALALKAGMATSSEF